ncbi:uncharacterized protein TNIN_497861 [Trichonephila inaurata madagascariensis]|uniref:Uncharacterized protein n=1 Tax=Trichonephila inaurata madagascariensis TaxID=2747483 RepID=A0A8X6WV23_9ARAC|nr:uncharacterized protein TNIN_497861 [Trichonephila inaurata madagascariensis]
MHASTISSTRGSWNCPSIDLVANCSSPESRFGCACVLSGFKRHSCSKNKMEKHNFTDFVKPFLRFYDMSPVDSCLPIYHLAPKAYISLYLLPDVAPQNAYYAATFVISLFYFYCTSKIIATHQTLILFSLCIFFIFKEPRSPALVWYFLMICTGGEPGCEYAMDVLLVVCLSMWSMKKYGVDKAKRSIILFISCFAFLYPTLLAIHKTVHFENYPNATQQTTSVKEFADN